MEPKKGDCERTRRRATEKKDNLSADNDHGSGNLLDVAEVEEPRSGGNEGCRQDKGGDEDDEQRQTTAEKRRDEHRRRIQVASTGRWERGRHAEGAICLGPASFGYLFADRPPPDQRQLSGAGSPAENGWRRHFSTQTFLTDRRDNRGSLNTTKQSP